MSTSASGASTSASDRVATRLVVAAFILAGLAAPFSFAALLPGYVYFVGPPLDFDAPHNGQVIPHRCAREGSSRYCKYCVTEVATGATAWDVKPTTARSECWNRCWNLTPKAGSNPASFAAGHQQFNASVPQDPSFSLTRGTVYFFEVRDSKGRPERKHFTL